ncbi:MAG: hypothetical protein ACRD22_06905 [Terriglobia bacterium]
MPFTDRSRIEANWHCPSLRYWQYVADSRGWTRHPGIDMILGTAIHNAIERTVVGEHYVYEPASFEGAVLFPGWDTDIANKQIGFAAQVVANTFRASQAWANIKDAMEEALTDLIDIERELTVELPEGVYAARPDLLFHFPNGEAAVVNIKSSSSGAETSKWGINPAIVGEFWALMKLKLNPRPSWVFHVTKGRHMKPPNEAHYFTSPLFIGYEKNGEVEPSYRAGWKRLTLADRFTHHEWAHRLRTFPDALNALYEVSGPHLPSPQLLHYWERAIVNDLKMQPCADDWTAYERRFGRACIWPSPCAAYELCWGMASLAPEENGFVQRTFNHPQESK